MVAKSGFGATIGSAVDAKQKYAQYLSGVTWIEGDAEGAASRSLTRTIAHNALVRHYTVRIGATRADGTTLDNSGQVRLQADLDSSGNARAKDATGEGTKIVVVDFGALRSLSGIGRVPHAPAMTILNLVGFKGDAFDTAVLYSEETIDLDGNIGAIRTDAQNTFETRTERVRLTVRTSASLADIASNLWLQFPDLPSDIDIRINNGTPAFTAPGAAQPNARGWDANTQQVVDLTKTLAALGGNPRDSSTLDTTVQLSARVPGVLTLNEVAFDIAFLTRISFGASEETTLALTEEGDYDVALELPSWVVGVQEIRLTLTATVPPERILEPVGPPIALLSDSTGAAYDLLLDVDHSGAARLDVASPFSELVGVRLPLRIGADGAEVRAVLYSGTDDAPTTSVDGGTTKPVDLAPTAAEAGDDWTSFLLAKPLKLNPKLTYWIVVVVGRGSASWSLGRFDAAGTAVPIRRGSTTGPWHELPSAVIDGSTIGARIRAIGKAPPSAPVAPLQVSVAADTGSRVDVTPTPKGAAAAWVSSGTITQTVPQPGAVTETVHPSVAPSSSSTGKTITLRITSRMTGTVKLSAVDVVASKVV